MSFRWLSLDVREAVAYMALCRPEAENVVDPELAAEVQDACVQLAADERARAIVIMGQGAHFSAGPFPPPGLLEEATGLSALQDWLARWRAAAAIAAIEKPVVAAINGPAIGQGLELVLACDFRLAAPEARFALPHLAHGLLPWDGGTQRLPRIVGPAWAADLLLTGRQIDAQEALRIGLVHQMVPGAMLLGIAGELARRLASFGPIALRYTKEAVLKGMDLPLEQGLRLEADLNIILQSTRDRAEGIRSFLEKRRPEFRGE
ncbi:MAG: enoyl-CoA hydratase/isomerase family protein [Chloroflexi bacterium]|nr:enoyl-CoA hydratase/isomerase family protein [Chloroflexota bacterium]